MFIKFKKLSNKYFEPVSMWLMILGLICVVQPWSMFFHRYGVVIILVGLVVFIFFNHIGDYKKTLDTINLKEVE